jgi:hypothetical protein
MKKKNKMFKIKYLKKMSDVLLFIIFHCYYHKDLSLLYLLLSGFLDEILKYNIKYKNDDYHFYLLKHVLST